MKKERRRQLEGEGKAAEIDKDSILRRIQNNKKPQANSILDFILQHGQRVSWNPSTLEVTIKGRTITDSDIVSILQRFTNPRMVGVNDNPPPGTRELYRTLVEDLGMPRAWIPTALQERASNRRGEMASWISL